MSEIIYDKFWYYPTSLVARDGKVTLLGHRYTMRRGQTITLTNKTDALEFENTSAMAEFILRKRLPALSEEADGKPQYVPKRLLNLKKKYQEQL